MALGTRYWTGGLFDPTSYVFRWTTNSQPLPYFAPWSRGYPNNAKPIHRVLIYRTNKVDASWRTEANTRMERFICEAPAEQTPNDLSDDNNNEEKTPCDYFKEGW